MGMPIDGISGHNRLYPYSKNTATGSQSSYGDAGRGVSDARKPNTKEQQEPVANAGHTADVTEKEKDPQAEAKIQQQIQELLQIQNKVIIHEQAHMSAGGELAGGASYTYTTGPDGKRYISGGEVAISTPAVKEPEEKIRVMAKVQAAALAPADPSPQDMRVAASASAQEAQARMEMARMRAEAAYGGSAGKGEKPTIEVQNASSKEKAEGTAPKQQAADTRQKTKSDTPGRILDFSI